VDVPADAPVYAECDEVRRMINTFLASSGVKQTQWLSAIGCQSISLKNLLGFKGAGAGAGNGVYPIAYRYFEQQQILEGKPKISKRVAYEKSCGSEGFELRHSGGKRVSVGTQVRKAIE
jgi:hypothetical protein